ncbi:hypothetical protein [Capillimicrobium parvum]|uniref:Uncharacterized protein n=1 Tax=Capillimicrobium parvum TaxID=2884022 RepID=A0A9E6Y1L2_9ACTN|nr:hypothetical protein [Capillimicrobium parvum]UGS38404.1 hypothetical protein DSM104329_04830 [Capillimicrobium parvum]
MPSPRPSPLGGLAHLTRRPNQILKNFTSRAEPSAGTLSETNRVVTTVTCWLGRGGARQVVRERRPRPHICLGRPLYLDILVFNHGFNIVAQKNALTP